MQTVRINSALGQFANEQLTITNGAAVGLTAATYEGSDTLGRRRHAMSALITCEGGDLRWFIGADPTTSLGHLAQNGSSLVIDGYENIKAFRAIATTGTNGTPIVSYQRT